MKISYNPKSSQAAITQQTAANDDIIFDLYASKLWAKGTRIGADWADISSKPSSLKNPHALTISLNGTSQGPYDGSAAKNINITPDSIGAATSDHNHDGRYVRKWTGAYGGANKFLKLVIGEEKGWIRLEVSDSNNALRGGYGIYIIGWGYHGNNGTDTLTVRCLYANDSRYTTALKVVRTSRNNYDFYFQFASGASYPGYTINYSEGISIDCTVTTVETIPTATWTSSLAALQLNASQVDWSGITNKPSEFNPAAHTHTVFKNNLMIKGTNGISDSASIHLGIGDSDTGFKWISDGKCQIYANNSAVGEWTSGGMNWFKNPTVNGNKVWNAGNDGSGSGLDADLLDGWHLDSIRKNVGYSWSAKYRINNWSRIIKIGSYSNILLAINFSQTYQASNHLYLISTGYGCGNIVQLGANGYSSNSAIKIRLTENTATSYNVEIYSTYGYNGATELSINCNYTRIDGNSTITTYLTYTAGGGTVRKEITSSYSKIVANLQGNSDTTTKLQTPRQINGTNFDGSANITTSYWGTTRTLTIGNSGKSVNGSADISWSLSEIGAADVNHTHDDRYLKLSGGTMIGQISSNYSAGTWIAGCTNAILKATANGYNSLICAPIKSGNVCISAWTDEDNLNFGYAKKGKTENNFDTRMYWDAPNNNLHAAAFTGHLYGTADNATKLQTARTIWGQSFDGTGNISGTLSGVAHIQFSADNTYNIGSNSAASKCIYTYWLGAKSGQKLELGANNSGYGQGLCIDTNLNVGIGTNTPTYKLHVNGTFRAKNSTVSDLFVNTGDATLKIYTGITTDAQNDGNICFQTSIDATDGQSHAYPTQYQSRCNIVLQPRGGQVYIGTNPGKGNTTYKLYVNSKIFSNGGFVKNGSSDSYVLLGGGGHKAVSDFATASSLNNYVTTNTAQTISGVKTFSTQQKFTVGNGTAPFTVSSNTLVTNLNADLLDGVHLIKNGSGTGIKQVYYFSAQGNNSSYIKLGILNTVSVTGFETSKVMFTVKGGIDIAGTNESVYEVAASTRGSIQVTSTLVRGNRELKFGYVSTSSNVEIWMAYDGTYRGVTEVEVSSSVNFTLAMTETTTKPSGFVEGSYRILAATTDNVASATKLQTPRNLWGNSFDGTKDINGSIVFPNIEDTATSNKISWSGSTDGADIYYQTTAKDQGNLVLNVKDDTNAYIQLALNGTFKSHFDVANSYWTGRSAQADKWTTARTFTIGNTAKNVDGSGNVSWSLSEIGVKDTWRTVQVNGTSIGNNTLNLCGSTYIGLTNVNGKVTFSLVGSGTTANQAILSNGTANGWTLKTLNIANWDAAYNFVSTITGQDADKVINKWEEIVNFLAGITEDNKLNTLLNSKLSIQQLSAKEILTTKTNNALFWVNTKGTASSITTGPFTDHPYALLSVTNYNQNAENNKFFYRSRLAFSSAGDIKVASCHHENEYKQDETWYNVLTSKNSGISGSTIKLNGTSITVYSSSTADGRYVKKTGDTMSGTLTIDTTNFGALTIKRNDDANGASIQFRGKSSVYGYIGLNNSTKDKQFLRWGSDTSKAYTILDTSSTYTSNGKGVINGTTITQVDNATNSTNSTNARKLVNWYSSRPTSLNTQFGDGSLRIFYATSFTTEGKCPDDATVLHLAWDNNGGWDTQLGINSPSGRVYSRAQNSGTWQPWKTLAFTTDIPTSLPANGGNADTVDGYHASGLLTALSNSNRGISLTVGGTTKSLSNISVGDADTVDRYHANTIYNAPSFIVSNGNTSNTYILLATITISGTSLSCAEFTTLFQNRECLDSSSFILSGAIRRDSTTRVTATLSYITLHTETPRNIYLRSDDGVTFRVYIQSAAGSWTTYYRAIPIVDSGNITYSNTGTTSPISGSVLNIAATKGGNVNYASSAGSADTATKLTSSAGNAALPIYFSDGKPVACTASSVFSNLSNSGNNLSITVAGQNRTLTVGYATSAGSATKVIVNQHTNNDINYPLVWSNQNNANNATENQLFKSWQDLYYNPKNKRLFVKGSVSTANINATGTVTSAGFKHSSVTENADQYVLTAGGGYTFLNQTSNELAHEFSKDITVTSEWADIEDFYGGNQNFLTQPGTYIVQVYYNDSSADGMYEGYFSGIMSWFTKTTNSNNADEIVLHRVGHAYANTIYLRTRESLESETNPYTKLQISANTTLKQHTYKFKFKRIC